MSAYPQTWVTNENPPRLLNVKGVSGIDPDCLVAEVIGEPKLGPLWIVEASGHVCGIDGGIKAMRCANILEAGRSALQQEPRP